MHPGHHEEQGTGGQQRVVRLGVRGEKGKRKALHGLAAAACMHLSCRVNQKQSHTKLVVTVRAQAQGDFGNLGYSAHCKLAKTNHRHCDSATQASNTCTVPQQLPQASSDAPSECHQQCNMYVTSVASVST